MESAEAELPLAHLRLDDLLAELQVRLDGVRATRDRARALLEAVVAVGSNLDLETVLRRIVEAAAGLVGARYGALGVVGEHGSLAEFILGGLGGGRTRRSPSRWRPRRAWRSRTPGCTRSRVGGSGGCRPARRSPAGCCPGRTRARYSIWSRSRCWRCLARTWRYSRCPMRSG